MAESKKNLIVTLADKNYLDFSKQLFSSVYFNSGWQGDYMLLAHKVPEEDLKWFRDKGILIKKCEPLAEKLAGRWPVTVLSKLYLFTKEFKQWDRIIYLDADLIVNSSLDNLVNVDKISGISNHTYPFFKQIKLKHFFKFYKLSHESQRNDLKKYGFNLPMFCASFIIINTKIITDKTFDGLKSILSKYRDNVGAIDELVLSMYFANQWSNLLPTCSLQYNYIKDFGLEPKKIKSIASHFISYQKPIDYCDSLYSLWKNNFNKADQIDLANRQPAKESYSNEELRKYHHRLIKQVVFTWPRLIINYLIGLFGLALKKLSPALYQFLLKFKTPASIWASIQVYIDKLFGLIGIFLKKYFPWLYMGLKQRLPIKSMTCNNEKLFERPSYAVRPYQAGDENGLINIINKIFFKMNYTKWFWKYKNCPLGSMILVAEDNEKNIIGQFAVVPHKIKYYSSERTAHQIVDVGIEKKYRNQGFLQNCFSFFVKQGNFLPWGFVNEKMNYTYSKAVPAAGAPQANKMIKSNIIEKNLGLLCWIKNCKLNRKVFQNKLSIDRIDRDEGEKEINNLWKNKKTEIKVGVIRDWKFIKWRIVDSPEKIDLFALRRGGELIGYFSLEIKKTASIISDILILNKYVDTLLFSVIENFCRKLGSRELKLVTTDKKLLEVLYKRDYCKGVEFYFTYNDSFSPIEINDIYLTLIDADWSLDI